MEREKLRDKPKTKARRRLLTDEFIRHLKPEAKLFRVWDTRQHGLCIEVHPGGSKAFKISYTSKIDNKFTWYHIGKFQRINLRQARKTAAVMLGRVADERDPQKELMAKRDEAAKAKAKTGETLEEVAARYVERYAKRKNKSWRQAEKLMKNHILPTLGEREVQDITRKDILHIIDKITNEDDHPITANTVLAAISAVLRWAVKQDILTNNVARGIEGNEPVKDKRSLKDGELKMVWPAFDKLGFFQSSALRLMLLLAQRPGEICAMRWQDIDLEKALWTLPGDVCPGWPGTKNKCDHDVPLTDEAMTILNELEPQARGPVFPSRGACMRIPSTISIWKSLDIPRFRPHSLRATAASGMDELGISNEHRARVLNHSNNSVTADYSRHDKIHQKRHALETWNARLMSIVEGREAASNIVPLSA